MSPKLALNYPDILGEIAKERLTSGVIQAAMAIRPRIARAGRPFDVLILLQNAADCPVDVTITLQVPEVDAKKQKGKFTLKAQRIVVGVQPAEVGYAILPVYSARDVAISHDYKIAAEITARPLGKPNRVRSASGGAIPNRRLLTNTLVDEINNLKRLSFGANKSSLLSTNTMDVTFSLLMGDSDTLNDETRKSGWVSLWTIKDYRADDDRMLLAKHHDEMRDLVLPALDYEQFYPAIHERVQMHFKKAGYALRDLESSFVARLMCFILQYSVPNLDPKIAENMFPAPHLNVSSLFVENKYLFEDDEPLSLPRWASGMLKAIEQDKRAAQYPVKGLVHFAFDDLLYDAVMMGFDLLADATDEDMGTPEERHLYAEQLIARLLKDGPIDYGDAYMPLVMGGALVFDQIKLRADIVRYLLDDLIEIMHKREEEMTEDNEQVVQIMRFVTKTMLAKYGHEYANVLDG